MGGAASLYFDPSEKEDSRIATVVIRGSTSNIMDDVERAVDDAINNYKSLTKDSRMVPGAGATEIELAKQLTSYGEVCCRCMFPCQPVLYLDVVCLDLSRTGAVCYKEVCRESGSNSKSSSRECWS